MLKVWEAYVVESILSHLRPMALNVLGYQSHLLQRCHPIILPVALCMYVCMYVCMFVLSPHEAKYGSTG